MANNNKIGIIDLGSNTFHLLIAQRKTDGTFSTVRKVREFVGLAEGNLGQIKPEALERGLQALKHFQQVLDEEGVTNIKAVGTAALRSVKNKDQVLAIIRDQTGFEVEVIDGDREAELIAKGVSQIANTRKGNHVIMDIGGGSTEFILIENGNTTWAKSYNLGVAVLHDLFHKTEPIAKVNIEQCQQFLDEQLADLYAKVSQLKIESLIGASGSFEVVQTMNGREIEKSIVQDLPLPEYHEIAEKIIAADFDTRSQMDGLPAQRVKLIVVAMLLIDHVLEHVNPNRLAMSPYALKEGLLSEM